jgi:hypothetical protein
MACPKDGRSEGRADVEVLNELCESSGAGEVLLAEVIDRLKPRLIEKRSTDEKLGLIDFTASGVLTPAGYSGLAFYLWRSDVRMPVTLKLQIGAGLPPYCLNTLAGRLG